MPIESYVSHREVVCQAPLWYFESDNIVQERVWVRLTRYSSSDAFPSDAYITIGRLPRIDSISPTEGVFEGGTMLDVRGAFFKYFLPENYLDKTIPTGVTLSNMHTRSTISWVFQCSLCGPGINTKL